MIFISGIISIIFQKNKLCTNKIRVIYFCPNCVNFLPEKVHFLIFFFFFGGGRRLTPCPPPPPARAPRPISQAQKIGVLQVVVSDEDVCNWNGKPSNPPSLIPSIYSHYFHTLLIPSQELTFLNLLKLIIKLSLISILI